MPNKTVPPGHATLQTDARETERKLFEGLARVKMFPVDPSEPGQQPGQMLPVSSFLHNEASQPAPQLEFVGPIEQAMRAHPGLTRKKAEEMAEDLGFLAGPARNSPPTPADQMPKSAPGSAPLLNEHEMAWAIEGEALRDRLRTSGLTVTEKEPPKGTPPLVATFHRAKPKPTKRKN